MPPVYFFAIDVSSNAVASGFVAAAAAAIKASLAELPGDERTLVGLLTFDNTLHFYHLGSRLEAPQVRVCCLLLYLWQRPGMQCRAASVAPCLPGCTEASSSPIGCHALCLNPLPPPRSPPPPNTHRCWWWASWTTPSCRCQTSCS